MDPTAAQVPAPEVRRLNPAALAGVVLALCLGMTDQLWYGAEQAAALAQRAAFDNRAGQVVHQVGERINGDVQMLRGVQALFGSSETVTRSEFADFVFSHDLERDAPGAQAVMFLRWQAPSEGAGGGAQPGAAPVVYVEPYSGANAAVPGVDAYADPARRQMLEQARDSGQPAISRRLTLAQDGDKTPDGFALALPVYRNGAPHATVDERRAALEGWVMAPVRLADLLAGLPAPDAHLTLELADVALPPQVQALTTGDLTGVYRLGVGGQAWSLKVSARAGQLGSGYRPLAIALVGLATSLVLSVLTWLLARSTVAVGRALERSRSLAQELDAQRREALALADAAHSARAMMEAILDSTIDGMLVDDGQGRILAANRRLRELWCVPHALEAGGDERALIEHMSAQLADSAAFLHSRSQRGHDRMDQSVTLRLADGRIFEQNVSQVRLGQRCAALWSFRDVTERTQIEQRERGHRHVLELLARGAPLRSILEAVVLGVEAANPSMRCAIMLLEGSERLVTGAAPSLPEFYRRAIDHSPVGPAAGSCGAAVFTGARMVVEDVRTHPHWAPFREEAERAGLLSCWSEPIRSGSGRILGSFAIYHATPVYPSPANLMMIEQAAQLTGIALEQAGAAQAVRVEQERFRSLYENAPVALWALDWSEVRAAWRQLQADGVAQAEQMGAWLHAHPHEARRLADLVRISDVNAAALAQVGARARQLSQLSVAQVFGGARACCFADAVGALAAGEAMFACEASYLRIDGQERQNQVTLLTMPGHAETLDFVIVSTLDITERKRADAELLQLAGTDFLTGLPNRREFMQRLEQELARLQRSSDDCAALLMLDIDHFKRVNDSFGHAVGDAMLRHMAALMRDSQRKVDVLGRLGGEEFAVLLPGATLDAANSYAERLRENVAATPLREFDQAIGITVSVGIAALEPGEPSADAALVRADRALYRAKEAGRNCVCSCPAGQGDDVRR
ncbi:MAG: diguanylate cyclase [Gammaproteobacteria bacterium]